MKRAIAGTLALALGGCAMFRGDGTQKPRDATKVRSVTVVMSETANQGWPVALEMVRVGDEALVATLLRIEATDWFATAGEAFRHANPTAVFDAWEVVPGTTIGPFETRMRGRLAGVLFCGTRLATPPQRMAEGGHLTIYVDDEGCDVTKQARDRRWLPW